MADPADGVATWAGGAGVSAGAGRGDSAVGWGRVATWGVRSGADGAADAGVMLPLRGRATEHGELELEAEAADPGAVGIDGSQPPARGRESRWIVPGAAWIAEARDQFGADGLDRLVEERPDVAATFLE